jgi:hypothetical protein
VKLTRRIAALPLLLALAAAGPCETPPPSETPDAAAAPTADAAPGTPDAAPPPSHCTTATHAPISNDPAIVALAQATIAFRASLTPDLLARASFCLEDAELHTWSYLPTFVVPRQGLQLSDLSPAQLDLAYRMLAAFLSARGYDRVDFIINTLDEMMRAQWGGFGFGAGLYHLSLFNDPTGDGAWGVQLDGHHLAITLVVDGARVYTTPAFFGGQPNALDGVRLFGAEESAAFAFVGALSSAHLAQAVVGPHAPNDVVVAPGGGGVDDPGSFAWASLETGVRARDLGAAERQKLRALIAEAVAYQNGRFADAKMAEVDAAFDDTFFAWMGATDGSGRYYFRVYSRAILIEYDLSTVLGDPTDHTHMLIRSPDGDAGDFGPFARRTPSLEQHLQEDPQHRRERGRAALAMDVSLPGPASRRALAARLAEIIRQRRG